MALLNRTIALMPGRDTQKALDDLFAVMDLGVMTHNLVSYAAEMATILAWNSNDVERVRVTLKKFSAITSQFPGEMPGEETIRLLSRLASPAMKEAWIFAWRTLVENPTPEISFALEFFKPVCEILEGQDRSLLDALPPEQREFAQSVLVRFNKVKK